MPRRAEAARAAEAADGAGDLGEEVGGGLAGFALVVAAHLVRELAGDADLGGLVGGVGGGEGELGRSLRLVGERAIGDARVQGLEFVMPTYVCGDDFEVLRWACQRVSGWCLGDDEAPAGGAGGRW